MSCEELPDRRTNVQLGKTSIRWSMSVMLRKRYPIICDPSRKNQRSLALKMLLYCRVPAKRGLRRTALGLAPGPDETRAVNPLVRKGLTKRIHTDRLPKN